MKVFYDSLDQIIYTEYIISGETHFRNSFSIREIIQKMYIIFEYYNHFCKFLPAPIFIIMICKVYI